MSEYKMSTILYDFLKIPAHYGKRYNKSFLLYPEELSGWSLQGKSLAPYSHPSKEKVEEFEKIIGWTLPATFKQFLTTFGLRGVKSGYKLILNIENKKFDLHLFYGLIEILASKVSENEISFCTIFDVTKERDKGTLDINSKGEVFYVDDFGEEFLLIAPTFEQFLEKIEFRKE